MKNLLVLGIMLSACLTVARGQEKKELQKVTISTPTVQCENCKKRIESFLNREDGVVSVLVDYKRKQTKVSFHSSQTNLENIKAAIANIGYDADDVIAIPEAYQKLPRTCRKPEDRKLP